MNIRQAQLPEGWEMKKLGEVCKIIGGGTPSKRKTEYYEGDIPWATVRDMGDEKLSSTEHKITKKGLENSSSNKIKKGNVIIATRVGLGKVCLIQQDTAINQDLKALIPKSEKLRIDFLFNWYKSIANEVIKNGTGMTVKGVRLDYVKSLQIPIPPLTEQKQIVTLLDAAFAKIDQAKANIEKNIANAKELFQSKLNDIFSQKGDGWEERKLVEVCEGFQYGSSSKSNLTGKVPVLRMGNIQNFGIDWEKLKYSNNDEEIEKYLLKDGDVLFNRTNSPELVGKSALYKNEIPAIFAGYLIRIRGKKEVLDNQYLNFYLNSTKAREYGFSVMSSSVNQANINASKLKEYQIRLPKITIQKELVKELNKLQIESELIKNLYSDKLQNLEDLKKSLLQKAFAGELT